jgi:hypothetical protein
LPQEPGGRLGLDDFLGEQSETKSLRSETPKCRSNLVRRNSGVIGDPFDFLGP